MRRYTVKEVCNLSGVTVKTLYHYQKIGLLEPCEITEAGYRLYGDAQLERLQQILFYRELDFGLQDIKQALDNESDRAQALLKQEQLLRKRKERTEQLLLTIAESIAAERSGVKMEQSGMFKGLNKQQWQEALEEQKLYLSDRYGYEMDTENIDTEQLNEMAVEPERFMRELADAYAEGCKFDNDRVQQLLERHIAFLSNRFPPMDAASFVETARYFMEDDFHREILEGMQVGLSCYLYAAAVGHAETASSQA